MKPREIIEGRLGKDIVIAVPSIEGGIFEQEVGIDNKRIFGEIALITEISKKDTDRIKTGDQEVLMEHIVPDEIIPGLLHFTEGRAAILIDSKAIHEVSRNVVMDNAYYSKGWIKEYEPLGER